MGNSMQKIGSFILQSSNGSTTPSTQRHSKPVIFTQSTLKTGEKGENDVKEFSDYDIIDDNINVTIGQKERIVLFVGKTKFTKGRSIRIVLEDATGKNDRSDDELEKLESSESDSLPISLNFSSDSCLGVEDDDLNTSQIQIIPRIGTLRVTKTTEYGVWYEVEMNEENFKSLIINDSSSKMSALGAERVQVTPFLAFQTCFDLIRREFILGKLTI